MEFFSSMGRFFASIMSSSGEPDQGHMVYIESEGNSALFMLRMLRITRNTLKLLGHLVVVDMQLWKERENPKHEFIVARVVQVKEADTLSSYAKGSNLAGVSILISRTDRQRGDPIFSRSRSLSSNVSSESATSASQHCSEDPQPTILYSVPDIFSSTHTQECPQVSTDNANPVLADDDGAKGSTASLRTISSTSELPAYDKFNVYPGKSIWSITWFRDAVCMARMDFTTASRPLLFEELAMMAKVTSDGVTEYSTPTTHAYWHAALVWGMAILHTGAKPMRVRSWLRPLLTGASNRGPLPAHVFGTDDELKPAVLLETFSRKWDRYKAGLIRDEKMREEAILREVYEARAEARHDLELANKQAQEARNEAAEAGNRAAAARKLVEEQASEIAQLKRMLAQLDGTTSV